jgi:hypothetical protein
MNNPLRYSDPSGYLTCDGGYDSSGECIGSSDTSGGYGGTNSSYGSDHHSSSSVGEPYGGDTNIYGGDVPNGVGNVNFDGSDLNMPDSQEDERASFYSGHISVDGFDDVAESFRMAVVGGTVAGLGGGKNANGAITVTFGYIFNNARQEVSENIQNIEVKLLTVKIGLDHSAIWLSDAGNGEPILYDPHGGEYMPQGPGSEVSYNPLAPDPVGMRAGDIFTGKYADVDGFIAAYNGDVTVTEYSVDVASANAMVNEIYRIGPVSALRCAEAVGSVIRSAGGAYQNVSPLINHPHLLEWSLENAIK